jgi:phage regulator Rha-like protein
MSELIILENNTPITTSRIIADGIGNKHKNVIELIQRHEERIKRFRGVLPFGTEKPKKGSKGGRPQQYYILNEEQTTFLISLMDNSDRVLDFKESLVKQFFQMRKWILEQKTIKENEAYKLQRSKGKVTRLQETDVIKQFIEYAKSQGSTNADRYYAIISKMENQAFFILKAKYPNVREILNMEQLAKIEFADLVVKNAIIKGMDKGIGYKDIYQLAKEGVIQASNALGCKDILSDIILA